jgi:2-C-methyl-D-erythritol 4-phosphate cytidylyltransferase
MIFLRNSQMHETVVIVAGGTGNRMQSELPKQFIEINGLPILVHTIKQFYAYNNIEIRLVLPEIQFSYWNELVDKHKIAIPHKLYSGGKTRFHSVKNGIENLLPDSLVAIHDGVRPFVSQETIKKGFEVAKEKGAAIPVVEVIETIRQVKEDSSITVNRGNYKLVQTPQVFQSEILIRAYEQDYIEFFTDDASVVEHMGYKVTLFNGNQENIKITSPNDLLIAEVFAKNRS